MTMNSRGFTLVEFMVATAVFAVVMAMTLPFLNGQRKMMLRQEDRREKCRILLSSIAWISRDLQQAGYHCEDGPLSEVAGARLAYCLSRDEADPAGYDVRNQRLVTISLQSGDLKYKVRRRRDPPAEGWNRGSTQVLAAGIDAIRFTALDREGEPALSPEDASLVEVSLAAEGCGELRTAVALRNGGVDR